MQEYHIYSPGKCLLTGGYLILEKGHRGLSIALSAHSHTSVVSEPIEEEKCIIIINSPELEGKWVYELDSKCNLVTIMETGDNPFVLHSIHTLLEEIECSCERFMKRKVQMTISSDGTFYSRQGTKMVKLGLGSSSTTVVSILCVLLIESGHIPLSTCLTNSIPSTFYTLLSQLACKAHNAAQGRIGSGFDVITAVFGSCVFKKTESGCLHTPFSLPPHVSIALSSGGKESSKTPVLVRRVREWRQQMDAEALWKRYGENNERIVQIFQQETYSETLEGWIDDVRQLYQEKLEIMYEISEKSASDIIPRDLYGVLKETNSVKGVIGCMVAGAGGFDSFYCLYDDRLTNISEINAIWKKAGCEVATIRESKQGIHICCTLEEL